MKSNQKSDFLKNTQYLHIKQDSKIFKYSLSKYNEKSHSGYYYCSDIKCNGKGTYLFNTEITSENEKELNKNEWFTLSKDNTLEYENHNYVINENTIKVIANYKKIDIKKKLTNIKYAQTFSKKYTIKNNEIITSP